MTTVTGTTGITTGGVKTTKPAVASAPATTSAAATDFATAKATGPSATTFDVTSGAVITQFLNNSGQVQSQFPSSVAVAYLRAGLTADGRSRHAEETGHTA